MIIEIFNANIDFEKLLKNLKEIINEYELKYKELLEFKKTGQQSLFKEF